MSVDRFFALARERYNVFLRRRAGQPGPWTDDPILREFRFCNIFREDDRVTRWMRENLTAPLGDDLARQYMAAVVFRWFNKIETGQLLRPLLLGDWDTEEARRLLKERVAQGETILGAAYMIKSPLRVNKVDGLLKCIDAVRERHMDRVAGIVWHKTLQRAHEEMLPFPFLGPFMAYEMVTDLRHTPLLADAKDIMTWASAGPGAARGLDRVLGDPLGTRSHGSPKCRDQMNEEMRHLLLMAQAPELGLWPAEWPRWEMREVEHTLCEFDKYERARLGEGRPKQRFTPHGSGHRKADT